MSYHRFPNLGEVLQGDMIGKLKKGTVSKDFSDRECNCSSTKKVKGECAYEGDCRACCIFYKVTCKKFLSVYEGNTQNTFKKRMEQHFQDIAQKVQHDKNSDTFAAHFATHSDQKPTPQKCRETMHFKVLAKVNPIGSMKTWGKPSCTLCMKERLKIVSRSRRRYRNLINACSDIYGACRHNPRFHRFTRNW